MTTTTIPLPATTTDYTVLNGNTLVVASGGTAVSTTVDSGGTLILDAHGYAIDGLINSGHTYGEGGAVYGNSTDPIVNESTGVLGVSGNYGYLYISGPVDNAGRVVADAATAGATAGVLLVDPTNDNGFVSGIINSGRIQAIATATGADAYVQISAYVDNTSGNISAVGAGATVDLYGNQESLGSAIGDVDPPNPYDFTIISGGVLQTASGGTIEVVPGQAAVIEDATIGSGTTLAAVAGDLALLDDKFGSNVTLLSIDGDIFISGAAGGSGTTFVAGDTLSATLDGEIFVTGPVVTLDAGALARATDATLGLVGQGSGTVTNSGAVVAVGVQGEASLTFGQTESGGTTDINSGTIEGLATDGSVGVNIDAGVGGFTNRGTVSVSAVTGSDGYLGIYAVSGGSVTNDKNISALAGDYSSVGFDINATTVANFGNMVFSAGQESYVNGEIYGGTITNAKGALIASEAGTSAYEAYLQVSGTSGVSNSGTMEALGGSEVYEGAYLTIDRGEDGANTNSGTILASAATNGYAEVSLYGTMDQSSNGHIVASGPGEAVIYLSGSTVSGGTVSTVGKNAYVESENGTIAGASISGNFFSDYEAGIYLENDKIASGTVVETDNEASFVWVSNSATLTTPATIVASGYYGFFDEELAYVSGGTAVVNDGNIEGVATSNSYNVEVAIYTASGGSVTNSNTILMTADDESAVYGSITTTAGIVTNYKTIEATSTDNSYAEVAIYNSQGTVTNKGTMTASAGDVAESEVGVFANGGTVVNAAGGKIQSLADGEAGAFTYILVNSGGSFSNSGTVLAKATGEDSTAEVSVFANSGGTVTNSATMEAQSTSGTNAEINIYATSGTVTNTKGGTMEALASNSSDAGVYISGGQMAVTNSGSMLASATNDSEAWIDIYAGSGGSITNTATGNIDGIASNEASVSVDLETRSGPITNSGHIVLSAQGISTDAQLYISGGTVTNTKGAVIELAATGDSEADGGISGTTSVTNGGTIEALATNTAEAFISISSPVIDNSGGTLSASAGTAAEAGITLDGNVSGGTLKTQGDAAIGADLTDASLTNVTIAAGSLVGAQDGGLLTISSGDVVDKGATLIAIDDATVVINGALSNSGTVSAVFGGYVDIASGGSVSGGAIVIGPYGTVGVSGTTLDSITFAPDAVDGTLDLVDSTGNTSAYNGSVVGFGGTNGTNTTEEIDLVSVGYSDTATATFVDTDGTAGGVLVISSGGVEVAEIKLTGDYQFATFNIVSGVGDTLAVVDPPATGGGATTSTSTNVALLGHYMASTFVTGGGASVPPPTSGVSESGALAIPHHG